MIRDLVSELEKLGGGSISDAREALRDDTKRKEVKEKVESIASKARESQANALENSDQNYFIRLSELTP